MFRHRVLSLRAFDAQAMMVGAKVITGAELETNIVDSFSDTRVTYLHIHNAGPGCYNCRVDGRMTRSAPRAEGTPDETTLCQLTFAGALAIVLPDSRAHGERFSELVYEHRRHAAVRFFGSESDARQWLQE